MKEQLSCMMDGALDDASADAAIDRARRDAAARRAWDTYHLIGDTLRGETLLSANFADKVLMSLDAEPTVLAPVARRSASTARMRWTLPLAASIMGVGAVGWVAQSVSQSSGTTVVVQAHQAPAQLVAATLPAAAPVPKQVKVESAPIRASFAREYLIAHQTQSPSASIGGFAQYVRTVSEVRDEPVQ